MAGTSICLVLTCRGGLQECALVDFFACILTIFILRSPFQVLNSQASLAAAEREAVAAVNKLKEPIEQVLQQFYDEFKQRS